MRSSSIIGSASFVNIVLRVLRIKAIALLLGPTGIGLIGLLQNILGTVSTIVGLGISNAGTRNVAKASSENVEGRVDGVQKALLLLSLGLGVLGSGLLWFLREPIANHLLNDADQADLIGWIALGVFFTVAASSQTAVLAGLRRIAYQAKLTVGSALITTVLGLGAVYALGGKGLIVYILVSPLATYLLGSYFVNRLPRSNTRIAFSVVVAEAKCLLRLGLPFMVAGLSVSVGHLLLRKLVLEELGNESLGLFQAAWGISMTYLGFVLTAMARDYYPRLTSSINEPDQARRLINEQAEVALLIAGPAVVLMIGWTPLLLNLLYSEAFLGAVDLLRWQLLGDVLKIASWPMGFIMLATGRSTLFMITEASALLILVLSTSLMIDRFGLSSAGMAYVLMYVVYLTGVMVIAYRILGYRWSIDVIKYFALALGSALAVWSVAWLQVGAVGVISLAVAAGLGVLAIRQLRIGLSTKP